MVGAGPAGLACASILSERGHNVTLFEASDAIGGQFKLAANVPGKEEFVETLKYYQARLQNVQVKLNTRASLNDLMSFEKVVIATGVAPREPEIPGLKESKIAIRYDELLRGEKKAGNRVGIIGAGGIGFDVATFLSAAWKMDPEKPQSIESFNKQWGISTDPSVRGGLVAPEKHSPKRTIYLMQRKEGKLGSNLSKTTGWIHRAALKQEGVINIAGVTYKRVLDNGLVIEVDGKEQTLQVDSIIVCAGQNPVRDLFDQLKKAKKEDDVHLIGGAFEAKEIDAKAAIRQASILASKI